MIKINKLSKNFDSCQVLKNINLEFTAGKVYGIVGANGAGKTTLFRCIAGLENYSGEITSEFIPLKNHLGLLMTEPFFFSKITGEEYIRLLCNARNIKIKSFLDKNIFDLPLNQYASTYSTGMKKKLALTAILMQENKYLILDEPYNGVDIQSNLILTEIINKLKKLDKVILISSHIFSMLRDTCDEIHLLKKGEEVRTFQKDDFTRLEEEMKVNSIGDRIDRFDLK